VKVVHAGWNATRRRSLAAKKNQLIDLLQKGHIFQWVMQTHWAG
jgi:hypothetical protein